MARPSLDFIGHGNNFPRPAAAAAAAARPRLDFIGHGNNSPRPVAAAAARPVLGIVGHGNNSPRPAAAARPMLGIVGHGNNSPRPAAAARPVLGIVGHGNNAPLPAAAPARPMLGIVGHGNNAPRPAVAARPMLGIAGHGNNAPRPAAAAAGNGAAAAPAPRPRDFYIYLEQRGDRLQRVNNYAEAILRLPNGQTFHEYTATHPERVGPAGERGAFGHVKIVTIGEEQFVLKHIAWRHGNPIDAITEVEMLQAVDGSEYVMRVLAAIVYADEAYILSPYIKGQTLARWLMSNPSREDRIRVYNQLLDGIDDIHRRGILHRDVKPENIWVPSNPAIPAFFLDFGVSTNIGEENIYRGTRRYIPDHLEGRGPQTVQQNYYALGVIFNDNPQIALNINLRRRNITNENVRGHRFRGGRRPQSRRATRQRKRRATRRQRRH